MKTYARVQEGHVVELMSSDQDIGKLYHPALRWVDVSQLSGVAEGWSYDGAQFSKPVILPAAPAPLDIAALQAQLSALAAQVEALSKAS